MCNNPLLRLNCSSSEVRAHLPLLWIRKIFRKGIFIQKDSEDYRVVLSDPVLSDALQLVPCGKCLGCRNHNALQWAARCMLECKKYVNNVYVTLTYDEEHLPYNIRHDRETFEDTFMPSLFQRDYQLFMKRLRKDKAKRGEPSPRYFYCGEYGSNTGRPHYHSILFNCTFSDLKFWCWIKGKVKKPHYFSGAHKAYLSDQLSRIWGNGHVLVEEVTYSSIKYVTNYQLKKTDLKGVYPVDPYSRQSTRPGLARDYFDENMYEIYALDDFPKALNLRVKHIRYFDRLYKNIDPEAYQILLNKRFAVAKAVVYDTDLDYFSYLASRESNMRACLMLKARG